MFNPLKLGEMLSQASQMKDEMERKLTQAVFESSTGGGAVAATVNGKKQLLRLQIDPAAVASLSGPAPDVEMLQDLIIGAVNEAGKKAEEFLQSNVKGMLGGLNLPGLG